MLFLLPLSQKKKKKRFLLIEKIANEGVDLTGLKMNAASKQTSLD
jgi:hypothetical protein